MKTRAGKLTLIIGSMFSGKSTELQRQGRRHELAGKKVLYVKPSVDTRYKKNSISTHDGLHVDALPCRDSEAIHKWLKEFPSDVVCIDEVQFFDSKIVRTVNLILMEGIDVIASGLDLDRFGQPFGAVPTLVCLAEEVIKVKAVCQGCGEDAWVSAGTFDSNEQVVVGESDKYKPLCRTCYYRKGGIL